MRFSQYNHAQARTCRPTVAGPPAALALVRRLRDPRPPTPRQPPPRPRAEHDLGRQVPGLRPRAGPHAGPYDPAMAARPLKAFQILSWAGKWSW
jgi:hypothetical protein